MQVRLTEDVTSFEFDIDTLTDESLHERYLRLRRDLDLVLDLRTSNETSLPAPAERVD
jgi:hypothetical protein